MPPTTDEDPYAHVAKGLLKLKNDQSRKLVEVTKITEEEKSKIPEIKRTKAEIAFQKMQEKMQTERIKQKASMTHKQRVEEFNRHLDSLTEHFDIPKVSWTK
ncbi:Protein FAM32A [Eufriesea mexicana]|uniref:Protein FAM32A n=1 Tax=Eufriesea mexicana TaxID=516756 RepID=A0A310SCP1_9HYME|nr:Protein FAM32A [Eufriesea mexicana]